MKFVDDDNDDDGVGWLPRDRGLLRALCLTYKNGTNLRKYITSL